jgi:hypothetical protein
MMLWYLYSDIVAGLLHVTQTRATFVSEIMSKPVIKISNHSIRVLDLMSKVTSAASDFDDDKLLASSATLTFFGASKERGWESNLKRKTTRIHSWSHYTRMIRSQLDLGTDADSCRCRNHLAVGELYIAPGESNSNVKIKDLHEIVEVFFLSSCLLLSRSRINSSWFRLPRDFCWRRKWNRECRLIRQRFADLSHNNEPEINTIGSDAMNSPRLVYPRAARRFADVRARRNQP